MKNLALIADLVAVLVAALGLVAIHVWAGPCDGVLELASGNATLMRCAYACKVATLLMAIIVAVGVVGMVAKARACSAVLLFLAVALVLITIDSAVGIGVCKSPMACWTMRTWIDIVAGVAAICGLTGLFAGVSKKQVK